MNSINIGLLVWRTVGCVCCGVVRYLISLIFVCMSPLLVSPCSGAEPHLRVSACQREQSLLSWRPSWIAIHGKVQHIKLPRRMENCPLVYLGGLRELPEKERVRTGRALVVAVPDCSSPCRAAAARSIPLLPLAHCSFSSLTVFGLMSAQITPCTCFLVYAGVNPVKWICFWLPCTQALTQACNVFIYKLIALWEWCVSVGMNICHSWSFWCHIV